MISCTCREALQHSFATVRDAVTGQQYDAILANSEQLNRTAQWLTLYRCRICGKLWVEGCCTSGHMEIYYLYPVPPTADPVRWLHEEAVELPIS